MLPTGGENPWDERLRRVGPRGTGSPGYNAMMPAGSQGQPWSGGRGITDRVRASMRGRPMGSPKNLTRGVTQAMSANPMLAKMFQGTPFGQQKPPMQMPPQAQGQPQNRPISGAMESAGVLDPSFLKQYGQGSYGAPGQQKQPGQPSMGMGQQGNNGSNLQKMIAAAAGGKPPGLQPPMASGLPSQARGMGNGAIGNAIGRMG